MHVHYPGHVSAGRIDRAAWAAVVQRLINEEAGGNKTKFAGLIGRTYKTINRWLNSEGSVSEGSVRAVAEALHISPVELLVKVGYYSEADLVVQPPPLDSENDEALQAILESDFPPRVKMRMIRRLEELRARERAHELEEVKWWIEQAGA